jgi:hypothetical protein
MKNVLACLLCSVLIATNCFAIDGGPWGGNNQVTVTGIYAGVLVPVPVTLDPGPPPVTTTDNSLALFTLVVPKVGLGNGTAAVFRNGLSYSGTIQASADPDSAKLTGIISTLFQETVLITSTVTGVITYNANGQFVNAHIKATIGSTTAARIRGQATLTYQTDNGDPSIGNSGGPITYKIRGFKQAEASS